MQILGWVVANIIPPSAIRPLFESDGSPTDQTREFFNLISKVTIENDGDPTGVLDPLFIGQHCVDTTNQEEYVAVSLSSAGWKQTT